MTSTPEHTLRRPRAYWQQLYQDWQASGLSKADFCRQQSIKPASFYQWCKQFAQDSDREPALSGGVPPADPVFLPVHVSPSSIPSSPGVLSLCIADVTLHYQGHVTAEQLTTWVRAIRQAVCSA